MIDAVAPAQLPVNYQAISQGVIDLRNLLSTSCSLIGIALLINTLIVDLRKGV